MKSQPKVYFKNLDSLRFLAATAVVIEHCIMFKGKYGNELSNLLKPHLEGIGGHGVRLFFALSGFLITYLLLTEKNFTEKINIKNFYIRRTLRIWPLYFLVGIGGTILGPMILNKLGIYTNNTLITTNLLFLAVFGVNIQLVFFTYNRAIVEILWSICIEEQFYAIWPWFIEKIRRVKSVFIGAIILGITSPYILDSMLNMGIEMYKPHYYFTTTSFSLFGFGGLGAYYYYHKEKHIKCINFLTAPLVQIVSLTLIALVIFNVIEFDVYFYNHFLNTLMAILFTQLIIGLISEHSLFNMENNFFSLLGRISYGTYIYHPFVVQIILFFFYKYLKNSIFVYDVLFPLTCIILTHIISYISYEFFEKYFLKLKLRFTQVENRI